MISPLVVATILVALVFELVNGAHDCSNAVATIVGTKVLKFRQAVFMSATLNLLGALLMGTAVASAIGNDVVQRSVISPVFVIAALLAAITWGIFTWKLGLPSSSSHALVGGLVGAGIAAGGMNAIKLAGLQKIGLAIVISPFAGGILAALVFAAINYFGRDKEEKKVNDLFAKLQVLSSGFVSFSHGSNDAQKTMGIIAMLIAGNAATKVQVPTWVIVMCAATMFAGTMIAGKRIIATMSEDITELTPASGFSAETAAALVISVASRLGVPVSTTHVVNGGIFGVGLSSGNTVKGGVIVKIIGAWVLTLPICGLLGALIYSAMAH